MEIYNKVMEMLPHVSEVLVSLSILVSVIVRIPGVKGKAEAEGIIAKVLAVVPTIGKNPRTKALEKALAEIKKK